MQPAHRRAGGEVVGCREEVETPEQLGLAGIEFLAVADGDLAA